jgi:glycosyltransferase involved in cell wall biosynthesis
MQSSAQGQTETHDAPPREVAFETAVSAPGTAASEKSPASALEIAFVSSHARHGGSEHYFATLLEALDPGSIKEVVVLEQGPLVEEIERLGRRPTIIPTSHRPTGIFRSALRLRRLLRRSRPAVVHANGIKAALVSTIATTGTGIPFVWIKHDISRDGWLARLVAARCARVVAVSEFVASNFPARVRHKVEVIHNGIGPIEFTRAAGRRCLLEAIGESEPVKAVCLVGRLDPAKGHEELLSAVPRLRSRFPRLRVVFIGGEDPVYPGYEDVLRSRTRELGIEEWVRFLGYRDDARLLIAGCDALVIASYANERGLGQEAFAFVGLEALATGTPVVAYADGGIPELLGGCGVLVEPGNRAALAHELGRLFDDPSLCRKLRRSGRKRARTELALEQSVAALMDVYAAASKEV